MSEKRFKIEQKNVIKMSEKYRLIKHNKNLAEIENDRGVGLLFLVDEDCERKLKIIVDLLNEKDKEIGLLRLELETHKNPLWSTREAEKKVNKLSDSLADEVKKNGLLNEELNQLRIENMRLKKKGGDDDEI